MSKFVPKLLIGLATALPNINSDMILLKVKLFKNQFGCGNSKMVGYNKLEFWPRINIFFKIVDE